VYVYGGVRFEHAVTFLREQSRARRAKRGLWGPPCRGNTQKADPSIREPKPTRPDAPRGNCDPNYAGACVLPPPPDLDCPDIRQPVRVVGSDPHRLDGDDDGWGCEDW
jgi:micrococcal nuclease